MEVKCRLKHSIKRVTYYSASVFQSDWIKESWTVVWCWLKILSGRITVQHHQACGLMQTVFPPDRISILSTQPLWIHFHSWTVTLTFKSSAKHFGGPHRERTWPWLQHFPFYHFTAEFSRVAMKKLMFTQSDLENDVKMSKVISKNRTNGLTPLSGKLKFL